MKLKLSYLIFTSLFIFSCQQTTGNIAAPIPTVTPTASASVLSSAMPSSSPVITPVTTDSPTPSISAIPSLPTTCMGMTNPGKNFSVKCSYSIELSAIVKDKNTGNPITNANIKIERDGKSKELQTDKYGRFELTNLNFGQFSSSYGDYNFTFTAPGYKNTIKQVKHSNGDLTDSNILTFELEPVYN